MLCSQFNLTVKALSSQHVQQTSKHPEIHSYRYYLQNLSHLFLLMSNDSANAFLYLDNRSDGQVNGRAAKHAPVPQKSLPELPPPRTVSDSSISVWVIILSDLARLCSVLSLGHCGRNANSIIDPSRVAELRSSAWETLRAPNQIPTSDLINSMLVLSYSKRDISTFSLMIPVCDRPNCYGDFDSNTRIS